MLGHKVLETAPEGWEVIGADIDEFDITSLNDTLDFVKTLAPRILINCAAMTDVDASAIVSRTGSRVAVTRVEFHNDEGILFAAGTGTYIVG